MPKRIIDGEALWTSQKLGRVEPEWIRAEYANLIPLATANGTFELHARSIWSRVYAANRPSISPRKVEQIIAEFERVKLLFRFNADGREWGFWVGIDAPGRLPSPARRGTHERCGPSVPKPQLADFIADSSGCHARPPGRKSTYTKAQAKASSGELELDLPDWIPVESWTAWVNQRAKTKYPLDEPSARLALRNLANWREEGHDPEGILNAAVIGKWRGLFLPNGGGRAGKTFAQQRDANTREAGRLALELLEARDRERADPAGASLREGAFGSGGGDDGGRDGGS